MLVATPVLALGLTAAGVILVDRNGQAIADNVQKVKKNVLRLNVDREAAEEEADKLLKGHEDLINVKSAKKGTPKRRSETLLSPDLPLKDNAPDRQSAPGLEIDDLADFLNQIQMPEDQLLDQSPDRPPDPHQD